MSWFEFHEKFDILKNILVVTSKLYVNKCLNIKNAKKKKKLQDDGLFVVW